MGFEEVLDIAVTDRLLVEGLAMVGHSFVVELVPKVLFHLLVVVNHFQLHQIL